jgi:hypothetical protein
MPYERNYDNSNGTSNDRSNIYILIIDIQNSRTYSLVSPDFYNSLNQPPIPGFTSLQWWAGGVLAPNGKIYGIPWDASSVLEITEYGSYDLRGSTILSPIQEPAKWLLSAYVNKL